MLRPDEVFVRPNSWSDPWGGVNDAEVCRECNEHDADWIADHHRHSNYLIEVDVIEREARRAWAADAAALLRLGDAKTDKAPEGALSALEGEEK